MDWSSLDLRFTSALTIILLVISFGFPFLVLALLLKYRSRMEEPAIEKRIGSLYENINPERRAAILFSFLFLLRRLIYIMSIFFLQNYTLTQITLLFFQSYVMLGYLIRVQPFNVPLMNKIEILNELCVLFATYHMLCFTDFVSDPVMQSNVGYSLLGFTGFALAVNVAALLYTSILQLKKVIKKLLLKWGVLKEKLKVKKTPSIQTYSLSYQKKLQELKKQGKYHSDFAVIAVASREHDDFSSIDDDLVVKDLTIEESISNQSPKYYQRGRANETTEQSMFETSQNSSIFQRMTQQEIDAGFQVRTRRKWEVYYREKRQNALRFTDQPEL